MTWVVDCSMALAWVLVEEHSARANKFLSDEVLAGTFLAIPPLWWYELANVLTVAHQRDRISDISQCLDLYRRLPLRTDTDLSIDTAERWQALALEHHLTVYDAAYLELAQRVDLGLATLDKRLARAATKAGVVVW